jgi:hypothetical protein
MSDDALLVDVATGTVALHASRDARIDLTRAATALRSLDWFGPQIDGPAVRADLRRIRADLELPIIDGSATGPIRKSALIDIGLPRALNDVLLVEVGWQSASLAPLFPVFAGRLRVSEGRLDLDGWYVPPLGRLGLLIDAGILYLVARRAAQAFLTRLADQLEG